MVSIMSLWMPILLSAVFVFIASSIIHMFLGYHKSDFKKLPNEEGVMDALRPFEISPGEYAFPRADSMKQMNTPEFQEKMNKGPVAFINVLPNGPWKMGGSLVLWFIYCILVGIFAAYIAGRALEPGATYGSAFQFAGTTAFVGYTLALLHETIWFKRSWSATMKHVFDGLIYGLLTGGTFGWLWPSL